MSQEQFLAYLAQMQQMQQQGQVDPTMAASLQTASAEQVTTQIIVFTHTHARM